MNFKKEIGTSIKLQCAFYFVLMSIPNSCAYAIEVFSATLPQSSKTSCQSQNIMLSLAQDKPLGLKIETAQELRKMEQYFRRTLHIVKMDHKYPSSYSHQVWKDALQRVTNDKYTLKLEYHPDILIWQNRVAEITKNNAGLLRVLEGQKFAMTSVIGLDNSRYATGHIVSILRIDNLNKSSNSKITVFNGAILDRGYGKRVCEPRKLKSSSKYSAGVLETNNYTLKPFKAGYLLMYIEKM